jgi:hypothetical protein
MEITVRDRAPEALEGIKVIGDGLVKANVDDARWQEFTDFIRGTPTIIRGGERRLTGRDATEAESFAIGQLTYLEAKAFAKQYAPMLYETVLEGAIDTSAGPYAKAIDYLVSDGTGEGQFISAASTNVPMVDIAYAKQTIQVGIGGIGYDYTLEDLRTSAHLKQPLSMSKQTQSILAYKRHVNRVALTGDVGKNWKGIYNNASATAANRLSGSVWNAATGDTMINDVIDAYAAFVTANNGNVYPTQITFPLSTSNLLHKPRATGDPTTVKAFIENELKMKVNADPALETLGVGPSKRVVLSAPSDDNMVLHLPKPLEFIAPQFSGYRIIVLGDYKIGGYELRRVTTVRYMDAV